MALCWDMGLRELSILLEGYHTGFGLVYWQPSPHLLHDYVDGDGDVGSRAYAWWARGQVLRTLIFTEPNSTSMG